MIWDNKLTGSEVHLDGGVLALLEEARQGGAVGHADLHQLPVA